jgi:methyl-accepting chemotaxis protein
MKKSIAKKMWFGFSAILILLIVISSLSIYSTFDLTDRYESILNNDVERINNVEEIVVIQKDMASSVLEYVMFGKDETVANFQAQIEKGSTSAKALIKSTKDRESKKLLADLRTQSQLLFESNNKIIELKKSGKDYLQYSAQSFKLNSEVLKILSDLKQVQENHMADTRKALEAYKNTENTLVIILTIISVLVGVVISYLISKSISKPVNKITHGLEEIANGNLAVEPIKIKNKDEIGIMANTFNRMSSDLKGIVSSVRDTSLQVAANAEELSASSQESLASTQMVAKSAEEQMAASEQQVTHITSSVNSMKEMNQSVEQIANHNVDMLQATNGVNSLVDKGSSVVSEVATQMDTIHSTFQETTEIMQMMAKHSDDIQTITNLITDISEQTNLLALNAAIEAARAGEYGKGFAVVAEEVRKLAEQSKNSASEIESMVQLIQNASTNAVKAITSGGEKVQEGLNKTNESLSVFKEIETGVQGVVEKVEFVSVAIKKIQEETERVAKGAEQVQELATSVADGANDTSAATEEQLASNEEISKNAQELANLSEELQNKVIRFKL